MKVFITGSEGFVGQHLVNLLKQNHSVVGLSRNTPLQSETNEEYVIGDILDKTKIYDLLKKYKPDVILHLAGIAKTWGNDGREVFNINLFGTLNIYEAVTRLKSEEDFNPKIIFISSAEVYGKTINTEYITEDSILNPINIYGTSKLAADRLSYQYSQNANLNIVILRPFPHIGPGQQTGFFVSDMASQIAELEKTGKNELLVGNLEAVRDYLDVRDVAKAYQAIIEKDFTPGDVYNICSGKGIKINDLLQKLLSLSEKKIILKQDPKKMRSIDLPIYIGSNEKFTQLTGWHPETNLDQTLKDVLDFWRKKE